MDYDIMLKDPVLFQVSFLGLTPHDKQIEILQSKAKHKVICAGRRGGKSKMMAGELLRAAMFKIYKKQILIAPTYKQSKIVYYEILSLINNNGLQRDVKKFLEAPFPQIHFINGAQIDFASTDNPDSIRGFDYGRIIVDEAAYVKEKAWLAIRPLSFDSGAPIWQISTPLGQNNFYQDYQRGLKDTTNEYASFHFTSMDNPHIDHSAVQREIDEYGESSVYVQTEIFANFVLDIDLMFPQDLIRACVDESLQMVDELAAG